METWKRTISKKIEATSIWKEASEVAFQGYNRSEYHYGE